MQKDHYSHHFQRVSNTAIWLWMITKRSHDRKLFVWNSMLVARNLICVSSLFQSLHFSSLLPAICSIPFQHCWFFFLLHLSIPFLSNILIQSHRNYFHLQLLPRLAQILFYNMLEGMLLNTYVMSCQWFCQIYSYSSNIHINV